MTAFDLFDITGPDDHVQAGPLASSRISVRFGVTTPALDELVPTLQELITSKRIADELLVDVASYAHVHNGPGLLLVGAFAHYGITGGERPTIFRAQKRPWDVSPLARVRLAVQRTCSLAAILEERHEGFSLKDSEVEIAILDRLRAPNTARTHDVVAPVLESLFDAAESTHVSNAGEPYAIRIRYAGGANPSATRVRGSSSGSTLP